MTHAGEIGFVASALVLAAFGMKDMVNLRIVAICSNFAFIAYALIPKGVLSYWLPVATKDPNLIFLVAFCAIG